ncbi:MAG: hypothetical protein EHM18_15635 [Acidobacteria bacterium]|nr:MAG: hypothetical protein EHM18_15635 [Acidobacteriota bacterium]
MAEATKRRTYKIVCQAEDGAEETVEVQGTEAIFDETNQRLTIKDGDEVVGGFIRLLRWVRKD